MAKNNKEPTTAELVQACKERLDAEALEIIGEYDDIDLALGLAFAALIEAGVDDPEIFLIEKGILQKS